MRGGGQGPKSHYHDAVSRGMEAVRIRRARVGDLDELARLFDAYRVFYKRPSEPAAARRFLAARFRRKDSLILVAQEGRHLIGFTQTYPTYSSVSMQPLWLLNDLYVRPDARRKGVGNALMAGAEAAARKSGAKGLILETQRTNPAQRLYESRGWLRDEEYLHYSLVF